MRKATIIISILILLVGGGAGWYFYSQGSGNGKISWKTAVVEKGDLRIEVTATGTLNAVTTVEVGTQVSGTIAKLFVDFNSNVKQGQTIALLDTTFLAAAVEEAKANEERNRVVVEQSKRDFDRQSELFNQKVVAQTDYYQALTAYEIAKSNLRSAAAQLNRAKINLQYAKIKAPINGVVISRKVDVGQTVAASFNTPTLFTIANDLSKMLLQANVDEADIGQLKVGQDISFTVDAYPDDHFSGKVSQIRFEPVTVQNVVNYIVIIDVPNDRLKLMPGMTANITVNVAEHTNVWKVPARALKFTPPGKNGNVAKGNKSEKHFHQKPDQGRLWIKENDSIYAKPVTVGISDGSTTEVSGDIEEGEEVLVGVNEEQSQDQQVNQNPFMPRFRTRIR